MSTNAKVVIFFGVILKEGSVPEYDESDENEDKSSPAYLAWSGDADEFGVSVEAFGHHAEPDHAVILASTYQRGADWSPLPDKTRDVTLEEIARINTFLAKHKLTKRVDRKRSREPGWFAVPEYH